MQIRLVEPANGPPWLPAFSKSIVGWLQRLMRPQVYTLATLPDAAANKGLIAYLDDEVGGPTIAFSDGTDWLRSYDLTPVS